MKSVKPGRGPSFIGGVMCLLISVFGVFWTITAGQFGAPPLMTVFGAGFVLIGIGLAIYQFMNATRKKRFSSFDITSDGEEPDPLNERFGEVTARAIRDAVGGETAFCPYCGEKTEEGYRYCRKCGKALPD